MRSMSVCPLSLLFRAPWRCGSTLGFAVRGSRDLTQIHHQVFFLYLNLHHFHFGLFHLPSKNCARTTYCGAERRADTGRCDTSCRGRQESIFCSDKNHERLKDYFCGSFLIHRMHESRTVHIMLLFSDRFYVGKKIQQ